MQSLITAMVRRQNEYKARYEGRNVTSFVTKQIKVATILINVLVVTF